MIILVEERLVLYLLNREAVTCTGYQMDSKTYFPYAIVTDISAYAREDDASERLLESFFV